MDLYKKYWLKFQSIKGSFFYFFGFSVYILVDSMDIHKYLNISVQTIIENPEMLKFVPYHLKTNKMCKHVVKKLPYLLRYLSILGSTNVLQSYSRKRWNIKI